VDRLGRAVLTMATAAATSRYDTILKLASGGMATVYVGTVRGALGFRQLVAIKKPHPHLLALAHFRSELVAEARLASMIHHANVVDVRDVEIDGESISLVMDYIEGASFGEMIVAANKDKSKTRMAPRVVVRIVLDALAGLHAAHELVDERDRFVGLVHRDISPQNILVGSDGIARVADFGVAKFSRKNMESTSDGSLKGKLAYMAPEYLKGETIDRRFDLFAMGVVLWEAIAGKRCFRGDNEAETLNRLLTHEPDPISKIVPEAAPLEAVITCALAKGMNDRFANAAAMAAALEASASAAGLLGGHSEVAAAVKEVAGKAIEERRVLVRAKLANEPSVASLMGVPLDIALPPLAPPATHDPQPPTVIPTAQKTDQMPATDAVSTESGPFPTISDSAKTQIPATAAPATAIPATTLPMTPRMEGAPELPADAAQARGNRTLASPGALPAASAPLPTTLPLAGATGHPPPANATHLSAGVAPGPSPTAPTLNDPQPANLPPGAPVASSRSVDDEDPVVVPASRRWVLPLVVGLATAAIATVAIVAGAKHLGGSSGASSSTSTATPASASVQSTPTSASTAPAPASATVAPTTTTAASSPTPPASVKGTTGKGVKPRTPGAGTTAAPPEPTPHPGEGKKPPPPNPYNE